MYSSIHRLFSFFLFRGIVLMIHINIIWWHLHYLSNFNDIWYVYFGWLTNEKQSRHIRNSAIRFSISVLFLTGFVNGAYLNVYIINDSTIFKLQAWLDLVLNKSIKGLIKFKHIQIVMVLYLCNWASKLVYTIEIMRWSWEEMN